MSGLTITQTEISYTNNSGQRIIARTLQPSAAYGSGWPGTDRVIREWKKLPLGANPNCTDEQITELENMLGEWESFVIISHPTLGRVSTPSINRKTPTAL